MVFWKYNFIKITLKKKLNGKAVRKTSNNELDKLIELIKKLIEKFMIQF